MSPADVRAPRAHQRRITSWFLLAVALHGLAYLCLVSPWMGEDEPWHFEYASHVADGHAPWGGRPVVYGPDAPVDERRSFAPSVLQLRRRFGEPSYELIAAREGEILASMREHDFYARVDWAGAAPQRGDFDLIQPYFSAAPQPPLYHLATAAWIAAAPDDSLVLQLFAARCQSWLLYVATAWIGLLFARRVFADPVLAMCAAFCIAWLPMHARQAAVVNNDVLARTLAALLLLFAARALGSRLRWSELACAALVAVLALLTKSTTAGAIVVLAVTLLVVHRGALASGSARGRRWLASAAIVAGVLILFASVFALWHSQHSPVLPKNLAALQKRIASGLSSATLGEMARSLVGSFNWYSRDFAPAVYACAGAIAIAAAAGTLAVLARARDGISRAHVWLCVAAIAAQLALVVLRGVGHGRYLMPAVPAFGALLVVGLVAPWPERWRPRAALALCLAMLAYDALFAWGGLVPNEYLVWGA